MSYLNRASALALALALVLAMPAAHALQSGTLREEPHGSRTYDAIDAERTLAEFSECVLERGGRRERAERFLRLPPAGEAYEDAAERLTPEECVMTRGGTYMEIRMRPDALRAALFAALYRRDFGRLPPPPQLEAVPLLRLGDEFDGDLALLPDAVRITRAIGDCAARENPTGAHAFLLTTLGGSDERRALESVMPALANCLPEGQQVRFSRVNLRGILGEALYKLRVAASRSAPAS